MRESNPAGVDGTGTVRDRCVQAVRRGPHSLKQPHGLKCFVEVKIVPRAFGVQVPAHSALEDSRALRYYPHHAGPDCFRVNLREELAGDLDASRVWHELQD